MMRPMMSLAVFPFLILTLLVGGCGFNSDLAKEYNDFCVECAKMGLWNEATMRWKRIVEIDPDNAQAHNNLGVAYESKGKFEAAHAEYKAAIGLDPDNMIYTRNYRRFKQHYERASQKSKSEKAEAE